MTYSLLYVLLFTLITSSAFAVSPGPLTLEHYLQQVEAENPGVRASQMSSDGAKLHSQEGALLLSPTFFASARLATDAKQVSPFFTYDKIINNSYSLGVSKLTSTGTSVKVSYEMSYWNYVAVPTRGNVGYYDGRPVLELRQSLWKNGFGSETRASQELFEAQSLATHFSESFKRKAALTEAEAGYWQLALARQSLTVQKEALERARKILEWNERRARLGLGDQTDKLQAQAAFELRRLALQTAEDEERIASRHFNHLRWKYQEAVDETLVSLSTEQVEKLNPPVRTPMREDTQAAEQLSRLHAANSKLGQEKAAPSLDLFGQYALNGQNAGMSDTMSQSFKTTRPTAAIGLQFSAPLDFTNVKNTKDGWAREREAADLEYQHRYVGQEAEWIELNRRFQDAKNRVKLQASIEEVQKNKLHHEKDRLNRGRTTTYQVLMFEQDYAQAQLTRLQFQAELMGLNAKLKLFSSRGAR